MPSDAAVAGAPPLPGQTGAQQQLGSGPDFSGVQGSSRGRLLGSFTGENTGTRNVYEGENLTPAANSQGSFKMLDSLAHGGRKYIASSSGGSSSNSVSTSSSTGASFIDITGPWR